MCFTLWQTWKQAAQKQKDLLLCTLLCNQQLHVFITIYKYCNVSWKNKLFVVMQNWALINKKESSSTGSQIIWLTIISGTGNNRNMVCCFCAIAQYTCLPSSLNQGSCSKLMYSHFWIIVLLNWNAHYGFKRQKADLTPLIGKLLNPTISIVIKTPGREWGHL